MKVNWGRGFLRIMFIYALIVGGFISEYIYKHPLIIPKQKFYYNVKTSEFDSGNFKTISFEEATGDAKEILTDRLVLVFPKSLPDENIKAETSLFNKMIHTKDIYEKWKYYGNILSVGFGVVLAPFLLWIILRWIYRGFKRETADN